MLLTLIKSLNVAAAVILAFRLAFLRIFSFYKVFAIFLLYDLSITVAYVAVPWYELNRRYGLDYRVVWLAERPIAWLLWVFVVFAMLGGIMNRHRGILRATRKAFAGCLIGAVVVALLSARAELALAAAGHGSQSSPSALAAAVSHGFVIERAVLTTSLVLLGSMLSFLLWFPVHVTRNVAVLCAGLLVYFAADAGLMFARGVWALGSLRSVSVGLYLVQTLCLVVWLRFINAAGEKREVRPGHSWKPEQQDRMMQQLEALNAALSFSRQESKISSQ
jgi:hypothetical protein